MNGKINHDRMQFQHNLQEDLKSKQACDEEDQDKKRSQETGGGNC